MKHTQLKKILSFSLCLLCAVWLGVGTVIPVWAQNQTIEEPTAQAFGLKKETQTAFPLLQGKPVFRLFPKAKTATTTPPPPPSSEKTLDAPSLSPKKRRAQQTDNFPSSLCVGGETFGVRQLAQGVLIVSAGEKEKLHPAYDAGVRPLDCIIEMNGQAVKTVEDVGKILQNSGGSAVTMTCLREGKKLNFRITPYYEPENGKYKAGIWIRDSVAGIGTLTYYHPTTGEFGGLGHGICDLDTGKLVPISGGAVLDVNVTQIVKGECGKPGELRGFLKQEKKGALIKNHDCGVFGVLAPVPEHGTPTPVGKRHELHTGPATLRCALGESTPKDYAIKITDIDYHSTGSKSFAITVCDEALLSATGGIIQGMSGSPIIQDGKLVGAVTHVLIGDPTRGYGIFIENMLNASRMARNE